MSSCSVALTGRGAQIAAVLPCAHNVALVSQLHGEFTTTPRNRHHGVYVFMCGFELKYVPPKVALHCSCIVQPLVNWFEGGGGHLQSVKLFCKLLC